MEEIDQPEFSDASAAALRRAGRRLLAALGDHIERAAAARDDTDLPALDESADEVRELLADYTEHQEAHCGELAPFEDLVGPIEEPDDAEPDDHEDEATSALITRLARADFMIIDEPALLADAERAAAESETGPPLRRPPEMTVTRALRVIVDSRGPDGLWRTEGVRPLWSETVFLRPDPVELDDGDPRDEPDDHPLSIFDVDGEIVRRDTEQYFR